ncbi:MAG: hypothetical protein HQM11_04210 [SAR324 cluster bacterium]|nr:hypothetical protein [SAR324 cluster bacterium]
MCLKKLVVSFTTIKIRHLCLLMICQTMIFPELRAYALDWVPQEHDRMHLSLYQGQAINSDFKDIFFNPWDYLDSRLYVLALSWPLDGMLRQIHFESEAQVAKHSGLQNHNETNMALIARLPFHWNSGQASIAYGHGFSYAWEDSQLELEYGQSTNKFLSYFLLETTLGFYGNFHDFQMFFRIHHRSGVSGIYCRPICGSNIPGWGIRFNL